MANDVCKPATRAFPMLVLSYTSPRLQAHQAWNQVQKLTTASSRKKLTSNGRIHLSSFLQTMPSSTTRSSCDNSSSFTSLRAFILWTPVGYTRFDCTLEGDQRGPTFRAYLYSPFGHPRDKQYLNLRKIPLSTGSLTRRWHNEKALSERC